MQKMQMDEYYMRRAIELAKKGCGWTNPNPLVGAVIEKNGHIIGEGYHERYGELHAERNALAHCSEDPADATIYVTLEPCCHYGKQPPCTQAIIESGIKRVVVGSGDPNPLVAGKGIQILREHGIEVETGVLKGECDAINEIFFHYMTTKLPLVTMKYAMTMDGKIATYTGKSQWITSEIARQHVHQQRNRHVAIMTGIGTVLADDPMLTCRIEGGRNPIRIICDTNLRIPMDSNIVKTAKEVPTIIASAVESRMLKEYETMEDEHEANVLRKKILDLKAAGCKIINPGLENGHLNLKNLVKMLGTRISLRKNAGVINGMKSDIESWSREGETFERDIDKIDSIYLEGGQNLNWSALNSGIVNKINAYIAPKIFGGANAFSPIGGQGVEEPKQAFCVKNTKLIRLGDDYMMEGDVCLQES